MTPIEQVHASMLNLQHIHGALKSKDSVVWDPATADRWKVFTDDLLTGSESLDAKTQDMLTVFVAAAGRLSSAIQASFGDAPIAGQTYTWDSRAYDRAKLFHIREHAELLYGRLVAASGQA